MSNTKAHQIMSNSFYETTVMNSSNKSGDSGNSGDDNQDGGGSFWDKFLGFLGQISGAIPGIIDSTKPNPSPTPAPVPTPQKSGLDTNLILLIAVIFVAAIVLIKIL